MTKEQIEAFLKDYEAVCQRHGMIVGGCGCCNSPYLLEAGALGIPDNIKHLRREAGLPPEEGGATHA